MKSPFAFLAALVTAAGLLPASAAAQSSNPRSPVSGLLFPPDALFKARKELGLSEEQAARIRREAESALPEFREKQRTTEERAQALRSVLEAESIDEAAAQASLAALLVAECAVKELEFKIMLKARLTLTAEQVAKARGLSAKTSSSATQESANEGERPAGARLDRPAVPDLNSPARSLAQALAARNLKAVRTAVAAGRAALGDQAGVPELEDRFSPVPAGIAPVTRAEVQPGFSPHFDRLERMVWWKVGVDPTTLKNPLRAPASVIIGQVAAYRARLDGAERGLAMAREAAEFLMWAQEQAGGGLFPFPAARGTSEDRAMEVATDFLGKAERSGMLDRVVRKGWIFDDLGDGGLQFDNGECGVAMFELYEVTKDPRYLASARRAADWAAERPLCTNWNYNSFSVFLLARAHAVTGEAGYLAAAVEKARLGVIPGQLTDGPRAGRWMDAHNARPAYHYIMMRALAQLAAVLPPTHPDRAEILRSLALGLQARNSEILSKGVMNKDKATQALVLVNRVFKDDAAFLADTHSATALQALSQLIAAEMRSGKLPLGPAEWGQFLEFNSR